MFEQNVIALEWNETAHILLELCFSAFRFRRIILLENGLEIETEACF